VKCSITKFYSSSSDGSLPSLGHAALLCEGRFIINGEEQNRVYLSLFGGNSKCGCELDLRHKSHIHEEAHDKNIYGSLEDGRFEKIYLNHDSINVEKIVTEIVKIKQELKDSITGWHFQNNCSDLVLRALRKGIPYSTYSRPLYSNEFGAVSTLWIAATSLSSSNPIHTYRFLFRIMEIIYYCFHQGISKNLSIQMLNHFEQLQNNHESIKKPMRQAIFEAISSNQQTSDEKKVESFLAILNSKNLKVPADYDEKTYLLLAWTSLEGIFSYGNLVNTPFKRILLGSAYPILMTVIYSGLVNRKITGDGYSQLETLLFNILKTLSLMVVPAAFSFLGIDKVANAFKNISDIYSDIQSSLNMSGLYSQDEPILSYGSSYRAIFFPIFILDLTFFGFDFNRMMKLAFLTIFLAIQMCQIKMNVAQKKRSILVLTLISMIESNIPIMLLVLASNFYQRLIQPATVFDIAKKLKENEITQDVNRDTPGYLPSKKNLLTPFLKIVSVFAVGYAKQRFKSYKIDTSNAASQGSEALVSSPR
jgi:hypothetical protein